MIRCSVQAVPVDCEVYQGSATITIEHLTGEVKPLEANVGDRVPGGARNLDGRMIVKVSLSVCLYINHFLLAGKEQEIELLCSFSFDLLK